MFHNSSERPLKINERCLNIGLYCNKNVYITKLRTREYNVLKMSITFISINFCEKIFFDLLITHSFHTHLQVTTEISHSTVSD